MKEDDSFTPAARFLLVAGSFVLVIAGMHAASSLIAPFLLAVFIAVIAAPPMFFLKHWGLPSWAAMLSVTFTIVTIGIVIVALVSGSVSSFTNNLPMYTDKLKELALGFNDWLQGFGINIPPQALTTWLDASKALKMAGTLLGGLGNMITNAFLILLTVIFILLETSSLPAKLHAALDSPETSMKRLHSVLDNINRYMVLKTIISLFTGLVVWFWLWLLGVDFPVLWGLVAFLFNYIPTIGSILAAVPAVLLALVQLGPQTALWTAFSYLMVNMVVGNIIEPKIMGRGLGLSTLVVFVSLVFWGWALGPVGMFLSIPLTMALKIALDANEHTRPIAILLGPEIKETSSKPTTAV